MGPFDVEVYHEGRTLTDTVTGSGRRALERRDEINAGGRAHARVLTRDGRVLVEL